MSIFGTFTLVRGNSTKKNHNTSVCDRSMQIGTHDQDDLRKRFFKGENVFWQAFTTFRLLEFLRFLLSGYVYHNLSMLHS